MIDLNASGVGTVADGSITAPKLNGNQTGSAPIYGCRAWVNFNGSGTVAIRASGNVSSITDNGLGDYTVNFAAAMPDENYCVTAITSGSTGAGPPSVLVAAAAGTGGAITLMSATELNVLLPSGAGMIDRSLVSVAIFR